MPLTENIHDRLTSKYIYKNVCSCELKCKQYVQIHICDFFLYQMCNIYLMSHLHKNNNNLHTMWNISVKWHN